ncbi:Trichohyalin [Giardia muris]|uniref:Trichohyalin n=1 Tax=Giardia muris TaxID=5742 RepID=A0A4Z1SX84_GIAMU|nr:Trichohyalin [Giardia muris]|eukprot:TNJ30150.1 Trichohyalin [Giardia muris]
MQGAYKGINSFQIIESARARIDDIELDSPRSLLACQRVGVIPAELNYISEAGFNEPDPYRRRALYEAREKDRVRALGACLREFKKICAEGVTLAESLAFTNLASLLPAKYAARPRSREVGKALSTLQDIGEEHAEVGDLVRVQQRQYLQDLVTRVVRERRLAERNGKRAGDMSMSASSPKARSPRMTSINIRSLSAPRTLNSAGTPSDTRNQASSKVFTSKEPRVQSPRNSDYAALRKQRLEQERVEKEENYLAKQRAAAETLQLRQQQQQEAVQKRQEARIEHTAAVRQRAAQRQQRRQDLLHEDLMDREQHHRDIFKQALQNQASLMASSRLTRSAVEPSMLAKREAEIQQSMLGMELKIKQADDEHKIRHAELQARQQQDVDRRRFQADLEKDLLNRRIERQERVSAFRKTLQIAQQEHQQIQMETRKDTLTQRARESRELTTKQAEEMQRFKEQADALLKRNDVRRLEAIEKAMARKNRRLGKDGLTEAVEIVQGSTRSKSATVSSAKRMSQTVKERLERVPDDLYGMIRLAEKSGGFLDYTAARHVHPGLYKSRIEKAQLAQLSKRPPRRASSRGTYTVFETM